MSSARTDVPGPVSHWTFCQSEAFCMWRAHPVFAPRFLDFHTVLTWDSSCTSVSFVPGARQTPPQHQVTGSPGALHLLSDFEVAPTKPRHKREA